jgi:hypothetical protein
MFRPWLIRSLFTLPILLCLAGWGWGAGRYSFVRYVHDGAFVGASPSFAAVTVDVVWASSEPDGWDWDDSPSSRSRLWPPGNPELPSFLGFGFGFGAHGYALAFSVPDWFLILILSGVLFLVWRKTRPNPQPQTPIPGENGKPHDPSAR